MSLSLTGPTPGQNSLWPAATRRLAAASLRARVLLIIAVAAVPALVVLGYYLYDLQSLVSPDWQDEIAISFSLVVLGVALVSLGFGVVVGEHTLRQPTEVLLVAAERWTAGELDLRLDVGPAADSEFGRLALAFNGLTESLGRRHAELQALNTELEARVAERTRELSDSNLRLRGEMAERERAEAALRQAQKLQAVGQLAGGIAHDFNNLLTSILGALDLLRGRMGQSQDGSLHLIDSALKAGERGRNLTSQLLGFSGRQRLA